MSVLQPLYFAGGRYTASIDRKLLTALIDPEGTGSRIGGVIPPSGSMQVSGTTTSNITIATGFCVIPDSSSPSASSPGLFLCSIDSSSETFPTIASTTSPASRTDLMYASVSESSFVVTNKALTSNVATLYTSTAHGFAVGETVVVSGVDEIFDGSYELTAVTTNTFSYDRTYSGSVSSDFVIPYARLNTSSATTDYAITTTAIPATNQVTFTTSTASPAWSAGNIVTVAGVSSELDGTYQVLASPSPSSTSFSVAKVSKIAPSVGTITTTTQNPTATSKPISSIAKARVPFAIKLSSGVEGGAAGTLPSGTNLALATITTQGTSITISDLRKFTTGLGGVHIYNSNVASTAPDNVQGHLRYDTYTDTLSVYDTYGVDGWRVLFKGSTGNHDEFYGVNGHADALHHTLGTGALNAAAGNHTHTSFSSRYGTIKNSGYIDYSIPAGSSYRNVNYGVNFTSPSSGRVLVNFSATVYTYNTDKVTQVCATINNGGTVGSGSAVSGYGQSAGFNALLHEGYNDANTAMRLSTSFVVEGLTSGSSYNVTLLYSNSDTIAVPVNDAYIQVTPMP